MKPDVQGSRFRVQGSGFKLQGSRFRVRGSRSPFPPPLLHPPSSSANSPFTAFFHLSSNRFGIPSRRRCRASSCLSHAGNPRSTGPPTEANEDLLTCKRVKPFPTSLFVLFVFLLAPVIAGLLASVLCGLSILRDKQPPWFHALLSTLLGIFSSLLAIFCGDVFHPAHWPGRIPARWDSFVIAMASSIPFSAIVAVIVVALFQERYKKHLSREERHVLRRQRRQGSWLRVRWFNLLASSALIVCLTGCLVYLQSAPVSSGDTAVVDDYSRALNWHPASPPATPPQTKAPRARPLFELSQAAAVGSPFCVLGLVASGGWLAFTVTYWRGYLKVRPRHHRHFSA